MNFYTIDRIEGEFAVIECPDKSFVNVQLSLLPKDAKEGSILIKHEDNSFILDYNEELRRKKANIELQNSIFGEK